MTVSELIAKLEQLPAHCDVKIAFDMGIRMDVEVAKIARDEGHQVVVITDKEEWEDRENW